MIGLGVMNTMPPNMRMHLTNGPVRWSGGRLVTLVRSQLMRGPLGRSAIHYNH